MTFAKIVSCIRDTLKYILHACMVDSSLQRRRDLTVTRITKKVLVHRLRNNSKIFGFGWTSTIARIVKTYLVIGAHV